MHRSDRLRKDSSLAILRRSGVLITSVIDIGVQYGSPDLIEVFPDLPHVLFEPVEHYFPHIRAKYAKLNYNLVEYAVSNVTGVINLKRTKLFDGDDTSHGKVQTEAGPETTQIASLTLDDYFVDQKPGPESALVKIDVDGHEEAILSGGEKTIRSASCVVIEAGPETLTSRVSTVERLGFRLWDICEPYYYSNVLAQVDIILVNLREISKVSPILSGSFEPQNWATISDSMTP